MGPPNARTGSSERAGRARAATMTRNCDLTFVPPRVSLRRHSAIAAQRGLMLDTRKTRQRFVCHLVAWIAALSWPLPTHASTCPNLTEVRSRKANRVQYCGNGYPYVCPCDKPFFVNGYSQVASFDCRTGLPGAVRRPDGATCSTFPIAEWPEVGGPSDTARGYCSPVGVSGTYVLSDCADTPLPVPKQPPTACRAPVPRRSPTRPPKAASATRSISPPDSSCRR